MTVNTGLILLLPLISFVLLGLFGKKVFRQYAGIFGTLMIGITTAICLFTAYQYFFGAKLEGGAYQSINETFFTWIGFGGNALANQGNIQIDIGSFIDPISSMMLVVISIVSLMVHIFSLGYMKGEERYATYYAYLSLFSFSMLGLVLAPNILQTYIFWELVGVSSYLLIGFYFQSPAAVSAAKKAFIVTRFADLGFLIGILILANQAGTLQFSEMIARLTDPNFIGVQQSIQSEFLGASILSWAMALVFIGGAGKSAMFPLHIWLPDAMEGPTPVSALIHAATMVVAGVYLVARMFPIYSITTPGILQVIAYVGAFTAVIAAIIACTQTDIKRVLAYSTMSQIAFMMFSLGVAGYTQDKGLGFTASMFHLFTHALFKALLFLCAGVIIHYVHSNDVKDMGGLRKLLPITHISFLIGCLAISGIPPFAGFFSKEEILLAAYQQQPIIYWVALITSMLTAFYMFRIYFLIFWNKQPGNALHKHEAPFTMLLPLVVLGIGAVGAGFIPFGKFVSYNGEPFSSHMNIQFSILPVTLAVAAIFIARMFYAKQNNLPARIAQSIGGLYKMAYHKFYIDEIYMFVTKKIMFNIFGKSAAFIDKNVADGVINKIGDGTVDFSHGIKGFQSGKVQGYGMWFLTGVILLAVLFIYLWR